MFQMSDIFKILSCAILGAVFFWNSPFHRISGNFPSAEFDMVDVYEYHSVAWNGWASCFYLSVCVVLCIRMVGLRRSQSVGHVARPISAWVRGWRTRATPLLLFASYLKQLL